MIHPFLQLRQRHSYKKTSSLRFLALSKVYCCSSITPADTVVFPSRREPLASPKMDDDPSLIEHPVARVLLAVIPAALVFLFFLSVLLWVCLNHIPLATSCSPSPLLLDSFAYTASPHRVLVSLWCIPWPKTAIVRRMS